MKRVSVIGCPGAGKTTFSRELARITSLPLVHLDLMYHDQSHPYQTDKVAWRAKVLNETNKQRWIIDGNYKSTFDIRLSKSDTIIFLDYPTRINIWRAVKRRVHFHKTVRADMPETWTEKLGWDFFVFILKFNHSIAPKMRQLLKTYPDKDVVVLKNPHQTAAYLARMHHGHRAVKLQ